MAMSWMEKREEELAERNRRAQERFGDSRRRFVERNPGAVSTQEYRQVMFGNAEDKGGLMAHERDMLREKSAADLELQGKKNEGELAVAQEKRAGMREQGADAARANADAALKTAELEWATKKEIAGMDLEGKKYGADRDLEGKKYGYDQDLEGKKYVADAQVDAETERGKANLEVAKQQGKDAQTLAETQGDTAERVAAIQAQVQAQKQNTPKVMSEADESKAARDLVKQSNGRLSYEQALAQVRASKGGSRSGGLSQYRK